MTVLVAVPCEDGVWIGCDTLISGGSSLSAETKWLKVGDWWVGVAGAVRALNLISCMTVEPGADLSVSDVVEAIRQVFTQFGWSGQTEGAGPEERMFEALLVRGGEAWFVGPWLSWSKARGQCLAAGSGEHYALGAMWASEGTPEETARLGLGAAMRFDSGCGGEMWLRRV